MKGQRPKLTLAERRKRRARNERRGRTPKRRGIAYEEQARYYSYGGAVVRVFRGRIEAVRGWSPRLGRKVVASARYLKLAPLPKALRRKIAADAADADRRARVKDMGVELPGGEVWTPSGMATSEGSS